MKLGDPEGELAKKPGRETIWPENENHYRLFWSWLVEISGTMTSCVFASAHLLE